MAEIGLEPPDLTLGVVVLAGVQIDAGPAQRAYCGDDSSAAAPDGAVEWRLCHSILSDATG
jgi:hypothetical protein